VLTIEGDQYRAYCTITNALRETKNCGIHFFVTGGAGTGKSYLLQNVEHFLKRSRIDYLKMAPTGIAAINVGGQTIHSALHITSGNIGGDGNLKTSIFVSTERQEELRKATVLIIDKISMVNAQLFTFISTIFSRLHEDTRPFGNLLVICFGDLMQLPPVTGQKVFEAPLWLLFQPLFLREPQRQAGDRHFFQLLNSI
jgi:ATP-dependent exoDNAse (exonuclease V) alpha subunit